MRIYLAGKISKNGWRFDLVDGLRSARDWNNAFPVLRNAIFGEHDYVGPFFIGCDHGCYHGEATHGVGLDQGRYCVEVDPALDRQAVVNLCFKAIHTADLVFAWIDSETAYGTLVEIGYALGLGKPVYVCFASGLTITQDMWFAAAAAHRVTAACPRDGLAQAVQQVHVRMRRN